MPTVKWIAGSLILWAYFSARGPGHFVLDRYMVLGILSNTNRYKT